MKLYNIYQVPDVHDMPYQESDADTGVSGMGHRMGGAEHDVGRANNNGVGGANEQHNHLYNGDSNEYTGGTPLDTRARSAASASRHPENYESEMYSLILILSVLYFYFIYIYISFLILILSSNDIENCINCDINIKMSIPYCL